MYTNLLETELIVEKLKNEQDTTTGWDRIREKSTFKKMYDDEFYYGDLAKLVLSSSSLKLLLSSPKTYKFVTQYGSPESQALRDGKLVHLSILEPEKFQDKYL